MRRDPDGNPLPIRMHHKGRTYYRVTADGRRRVWTPLGHDFGTALRRWAAHEGGQTHCTTFSEAVKMWRADRWPRLRPASRSSYERALKVLLPVFGEMPLDAIERLDVADYMRRRTAPVQANREYMIIASVFKFAQFEGWTENQPCKNIRKASEKPRTRVATEGELAALALAATPMWKAILAFAVATGMRSAELRMLSREHLEDRGIRLKRPKTGKESLWLWTPATREAVALALAQRPHVRQVVFCSQRGRAFGYDGLRSGFYRLCQKCGIKGLVMHDLRRTAATLADTDEQARELLGHHDIRLTRKVYIQEHKVHPVR